MQLEQVDRQTTSDIQVTGALLAAGAKVDLPSFWSRRLEFDERLLGEPEDLLGSDEQILRDALGVGHAR